jgi:hypothetical protein
LTSLFISEFSDLAFTSNGAIQNAAAAQYWLNDQTVAIGATSTPSNPFNVQTAYVLLSADAACSIAWTQPGAESVNAATSGNLLLPANTPLIFGVAGGMQISAIANS